MSLHAASASGGKNHHGQLRFVDLSFDKVENDVCSPSTQRASGVNGTGSAGRGGGSASNGNTFRQQAGLTGTKYKQPLSMYKFKYGSRSAQMEDNAGSPTWAVKVCQEPSHSSESPLFVYRLLSPSHRLEPGSLADGAQHCKRRRPLSANDAVKYYRPNSTHQYLTATDLKSTSQSQVDLKLGRPTRTQLLRARQRCGSIPTNAFSERKELLQKLEQREEIRRYWASVSSWHDVLGISVPEGESLHSYLTGARYNRANYIDARSIKTHGVYMPRGNLSSCFVVDKQSTKTPSVNPDPPPASPDSSEYEDGDEEDPMDLLDTEDHDAGGLQDPRAPEPTEPPASPTGSPVPVDTTPDVCERREVVSSRLAATPNGMTERPLTVQGVGFNTANPHSGLSRPCSAQTTGNGGFHGTEVSIETSVFPSVCVQGTSIGRSGRHGHNDVTIEQTILANQPRMLSAPKVLTTPQGLPPQAPLHQRPTRIDVTDTTTVTSPPGYASREGRESDIRPRETRRQDPEGRVGVTSPVAAPRPLKVDKAIHVDLTCGVDEVESVGGQSVDPEDVAANGDVTDADSVAANNGTSTHTVGNNGDDDVTVDDGVDEVVEQAGDRRRDDEDVRPAEDHIGPRRDAGADDNVRQGDDHIGPRRDAGADDNVRQGDDDLSHRRDNEEVVGQADVDVFVGQADDDLSPRREDDEDVGQTDDGDVRQADDDLSPRPSDDEVVGQVDDEVVRQADDEVVRQAEDDVVRQADDEVVRQAEDEVVRQADDEVVRQADDEVFRQVDDEIVRQADDEVVRQVDDEVVRQVDDEVVRQVDDEVVGQAEDDLSPRRDDDDVDEAVTETDDAIRRMPDGGDDAGNSDEHDDFGHTREPGENLLSESIGDTDATDAHVVERSGVAGLQTDSSVTIQGEETECPGSGADVDVDCIQKEGGYAATSLERPASSSVIRPRAPPGEARRAQSARLRKVRVRFTDDTLPVESEAERGPRVNPEPNKKSFFLTEGKSGLHGGDIAAVAAVDKTGHCSRPPSPDTNENEGEAR